MADSGTDDREAEVDQVEGIDPDALQELLESEIEFVERAPLTAVRIPGTLRDQLCVVCSDGAVFLHSHLGWTEIEPVPGTARAASWEPEE
jgi:hypothetical protein